MSGSVRIGEQDWRRPDRRKATILAGSLLLHVALLAWLALPVPPLIERMTAEELPSMLLELDRADRQEAPRAAAAPAAAVPHAVAPALPFQIRPATRSAPAGVPTLQVPATGLARPGSATRPAPLPGEGGDLRTALRNSYTGCVSADAVGLNRREREKCEERFGAAKAKGDPLSGMTAEKRQALEAQGAAQRAYKDYLDAPMGPGVDHRSKDHPGAMKEIPFVLGAQQDGLGRERKSVTDQMRREKDSAERAQRFLELQKKAGPR